MTAKKKAIIKQPSPNQISNAEKIAALRAMQISAGWVIVLQIMIENKEYLEQLILSGVNPETKDEFSQVEMNRMRDKRGLMEDLMNTPNGLIGKIERAKPEEEVNFDPYHNDALELEKDK